MAEVELNKVKVSLNNTVSQLRVAQSNLAYSLNGLKNSMGFPMDQQLEIDSQSPEKEIALQDLANANRKFNASERLDFHLSTLNASMLEIEAQRIKATNLPKLSFYAKYGGTGFGDDLSESFSSVADFATIDIKLNAPIFAGFSKHAQYQQAKIEYQNALENLKLDEASYRLDAENAKTKLEKAQASIGEEKENIALAESVLSSTNLQYQKGTVGLTDWINANTSLKEAQNNFLTSIVDYYLAQIEIEKANGTLKNYYNTLNK